MTQVTPELLAQLQQLLQQGQIGIDGRSPLKDRQLTDLRLQPTATDPRPLFVPSAESPRNVDVTKTYPYPRLLWTSDGVEITVHDEVEHRLRVEDGYLEVSPISVPIDPVQDVADALAGLTDMERQLVLNAQRDARLKTLHEKLAALPEEQLSALLSGEPVKRRPGRPRKT